MSRHDPIIKLRHMLDYAQRAILLMGAASREAFASSMMQQMAEERAVELVGEAACQVPKSVREALPAIPWADIIGMRHRLIHDYDGTNVDKLYDTVVEDLPVLIRQLTEFLSRPDLSTFSSEG